MDEEEIIVAGTGVNYYILPVPAVGNARLEGSGWQQPGNSEPGECVTCRLWPAAFRMGSEIGISRTESSQFHGRQ